MLLNDKQERQFKQIEAKRKQVNEALRTFAATSSRMSFFDLATLHPFFDIPSQVQDKYWDDGRFLLMIMPSPNQSCQL
jgi:hypothetical protein